MSMKSMKKIFLVLALVVLAAGCVEQIIPTTTTTTTVPTTTTTTIATTTTTTIPVATTTIPETTTTTLPVVTGSLVLLISDAQANISDFDSLKVNLSSARIFPENGFEEFDVNKTIDLTQIVGENAISVLQIELAEGTYAKIELYAEVTEATVNGSSANVTIPSEKLQIVKPFNITANETTKFVFDIEVVKKGQTDEYNLLPVIAKSGVVGVDIEEIEERECTVDEDCEEGKLCINNECE